MCEKQTLTAQQILQVKAKMLALKGGFWHERMVDVGKDTTPSEANTLRIYESLHVFRTVQVRPGRVLMKRAC
jgi:hypothetical protein